MRSITEILCQQCVGELEKQYCGNPSKKEMTLTEAINYCYDTIFAQLVKRGGPKLRPAYLDGRRAIWNKIRDLLRENRVLQLKIPDDLALIDILSIPAEKK